MAFIGMLFNCMSLTSPVFWLSLIVLAYVSTYMGKNYERLESELDELFGEQAMSTTNRITVAHNSIGRAIKSIQGQLDFSTTTLEVDINKHATIFVDIENHDFIDYSEIEIIGIEVVKDGKPEHYLTNITSLVRKELDKTVEFMNAEEKEDAEAFDKRLEHELSY